MSTEDIMPGQRWVSDAEPELGLGVVMSAGSGRVSILFPAADDRREYALETAPVRRVAFEVGDSLKTHDGISGSIEASRMATDLGVCGGEARVAVGCAVVGAINSEIFSNNLLF